MLEKEDLSLEEKIKLLGGKSGDEVAEKYGIRYFTMSDTGYVIRICVWFPVAGTPICCMRWAKA